MNELANQYRVLQKVEGWKVHMLQAQVEDVIVNEKELYAKLSALQKRLERSASRDVAGKDLPKVQVGRDNGAVDLERVNKLKSI